MDSTPSTTSQLVLRSQDVSRLSLTSLNDDVAIVLLSFMRPQDIMAYRQTCRQFFKTTERRVVWLNALRKVMDDHFVTEDTFPLKSMSLEMLQHAALSPFRFTTLLKEADGSLLEPTNTRILPCRLTENEKQSFGVTGNTVLETFTVAPGGRFVAVQTIHHKVNSDELLWVFTIWDLGIHGSFNTDAKPVKRVSIPISGDTHDFYTVALHFDPSYGSGTLFLIVHLIPESTKSSVSVYTMDITSHVNEMKLFAKIDFPGHLHLLLIVASPRSHRITGQFYEGEDDKNAYFVWDYLENKSTSWFTKDTLEDTYYYDGSIFYPYDNALIVVDIDGNLRVYNTPELTDGSAFWENPKVTQFPNIDIRRPFSGPCAHIPIADNHKSFSDYLCLSDTDEDVAAIYRIQDLNSLANSRLPQKLPVHAGTVNLSAVSVPGGPKSGLVHHLDEDNVLISYLNVDYSRLRAHVVDMNGGTPSLKLRNPELLNPLEAQTTILGYEGTMRMECVAISSMTGRVFIQTVQGHQRGLRQLQVMDYL
ncbi:hypothetical protein JR316_0008690 [Psilocybe cubensis]|uniref:Uncharacterized protein n=2 Tax=Psilocybe cubensis TaxID=181762 RepID=A0ACB8GS36_PSICU|nr:hypothetical protein JR316_0008690 [Psilocybe cubensis]KAH9478237.1 hypothetical protein JR316_0008690 [Psilocybe cubensis]